MILIEETHMTTGDKLYAGLTTVVINEKGHLVADETLVEELYDTRSCTGRHFKTARKASVCYERCAYVRVRNV